MTVLKKTISNKYWRGWVKSLVHFGWAYKLVQPLWKTVWRSLKRLKIELLYDSAIPLLGIFPKKTNALKDICTCMFITTLFTMVETCKQPKCPSTDE
uniref:Uncharacterized protein n=1 Tax=Sus scrofa TaxID=9823 RepID=A0A8D0I4U2_PIG